MIPKPQDLLKAEKQVLTGVYVRLLKRYRQRFSEEKAKALAGAVTGLIFRLEPAEASMVEFIREHEDIINEEINLLESDYELRRVVSDTVVLKVVYMKRQRGCSEHAAFGPVDYLKEIGIFLEGDKAPTSSGVIRAAKDFYDATPW
jgi:hypothetical protein